MTEAVTKTVDLWWLVVQQRLRKSQPIEPFPLYDKRSLDEYINLICTEMELNTR